MPTITNADVEAEARALLRDRIARLPWHAGLPPEERERRIAEDIDTYWPRPWSTRQSSGSSTEQAPP